METLVDASTVPRWTENSIKGLNYQIIDTIPKFQAFFIEATDLKKVSCDLETRSIDLTKRNNDRPGHQLVSIQFSTGPKTAWFLPIAHADFIKEDNPEGYFWSKENFKIICASLDRLLAKPEIFIIGHNFKFDSKFIIKYLGIKPNLNFDTMLAFGLFSQTSNGLKALAWEHTDMGGFEDEQDKYTKSLPKSEQYDMFYYPFKDLFTYGCADVDVTFRLFEKIKEELKKDPKLLKLFNILIQASKAFTDIETEGIKVDVPYLKQLETDIKLEMASMEAQFYQDASKEIEEIEVELLKAATSLKTGKILKNKITKFNIASNDHIGLLFFDKFKIPVDTKHISKKTDKPSLGKPVLIKLKDKYPIAGKLLIHRTLAKQLSSFVEAYPEFIDSNDRIHPDYKLVKYINEDTEEVSGTATGRLSCSNPNLQQVPARGDGKKIKKLFIPDFDEHWLVDFDFAGIELRVMAMHCQDKKMMAFFNSDNSDFHRYIASEINGKPLDKITEEERRIAKTSVFCTLYGGGPNKLAETAGISVERAKSFIIEYFNLFPDLKMWINKQKGFAMRNLYVRSMFGRIRHLPEADSKNEYNREKALRQATNSVIQADASDLTLYSLTRIHRYLNEFPHSNSYKPSRIRGSVHDSILLTVSDSDLTEIVENVKFNILEKPALDFIQKCGIVLRADVSIGKNWGEQENLVV